MLTHTKIGLSAVALLAVAVTAYAANTAQNDAVNIEMAKVSMPQAIATAEQLVHGKAARAEYEKTAAGWAYDVEVLAGAKVFDIRVDADKGTVISSVEDIADRDDDNDKKD